MDGKRRILNRNRKLIDQVQYLGAKASNIRRAVNQMLLRKSELEDLARDPQFSEERFLEATEQYLVRASDSVSYISDHLESVIQARGHLQQMVWARKRVLSRCLNRAKLTDGEGSELWSHCTLTHGHEPPCCYAIPASRAALAWPGDGPVEAGEEYEDGPDE